MSINTEKPIRVTPPTLWWSGDPRVEPFMDPVRDELKKQGIKGDKFTAIYNKAYMAVFLAIKKHGDKAG